MVDVVARNAFDGNVTDRNPMRVVSNGTGCEILFTLLQWPGPDDAAFAADAGTVRADLRRLGQRLEALTPGIPP